MKFAYLVTAARNAGVPEMWVDDAAQDIAIALWREGRSDSKTIRHRAMNASAKYNDRRKRYQAQVVAIDESVPGPDAYDLAETMLDIRRAWRTLRPHERFVIVRRVAGGRRAATAWLSSAEATILHKCRRKLRAALAA